MTTVLFVVPAADRWTLRDGEVPPSGFRGERCPTDTRITLRAHTTEHRPARLRGYGGQGAWKGACHPQGRRTTSSPQHATCPSRRPT